MCRMLQYKYIHYLSNLYEIYINIISLLITKKEKHHGSSKTNIIQCEWFEKCSK
jgi:hypothetical protein